MKEEQAWIEDWHMSLALQMAAEASWALDEQAQRILLLARSYYQRFGHPPSMRPWIRFLQQELDPGYDSVRLALSFPAPALRTLCLWAGLPKPPHCL